MSDATGRLLAQDAAARGRALDIGRSFLVQAPAGSGKTGLLIQRYLALLAHVDRPERIVAMTFTRKAAGEMRERVVEALADAADESAPQPSETHDRRTRELARAALAQDRRYDWQLRAHPSRLAIGTIDAFASSFARQAPLTSGLGAFARYVDDATALFEQAARMALAQAPADDNAWRTLVAHVDNHADALVDLFAGLLAKRDQWLPFVVSADGPDLRGTLDATLAREVGGELARACDTLARHAVTLRPLLRFAAEHHPDGDVADALARCEKAGGLPAPIAESIADWRALADWLLVKDKARLRTAVNKRAGFPAANEAPGARNAKGAMETVLEELGADPAVALALDTVRRLPAAGCSDESWTIIEALLAVLPKVAAQLQLTFADDGRVDFTQVALAALDALGDPDSPSDLLLRLDCALAHLLIDEFQDTSVTQLALIKRLTAGWTPGDGRTLFAVGDPMQSIYRFRAAEVRLFVEAQESGAIAGLPVECLTLRRNFRAQARLVDWVNGAFVSILGTRSDPWRSAVAFAEATATRSSDDGAGCTFDALASEADEARAVVAHVERALAAGDETIAILVRARRHAEPLLPALRGAAIAFTAVELDAFAERSAIRDLTALAHALAQPADRLAWLSLMRAPWCGLALPDLMAVAATDAACERSLLPALASPGDVPGLSDDGRTRLARIARVLVPALGSRGKAPFAARLRGAWLALGGPACVDDASDLDAAERFFALLASYDVAGDVGDWPAFTGDLERLREGTAEPDVRVRVMTLHKAKGLEFDTVIMPALGREARSPGSELLRWRLRPGDGLLIAPGKARGGVADPICAYLARLDADEEAAELGRLLYVGCTRAKKRLHLTAMLAALRDDEGIARWPTPPANSALARLWPSVAEGLAPPAQAPQEQGDSVSLRLARVPRDWEPALPQGDLDPPSEFEQADETPPFDWVRETARNVGVVVHRLLAQIAREGLAAWNGARIGALAPSLAVALAAEGVDARELDGAVAQVQDAIRKVLADPRGRWLFDPSHEQARSEWAIAGVDGGALVHRTLDRTFVERGVRWIVDFKTGTHEGGDVEAFLDRERERYAPALETYARLVRGLDVRPIRLALYHPLARGWREWPFAE